MVKFSVLIANYNNGRYLQETIDSVLAQTYANWEVIIIDDKSTDNSFEIYEKYKNDSRFHIYYNEENKGCGFTKHRCVAMANGELCGFLDADDALLPNALEEHAKAHSERPDVSCVISRKYWCDKDMNVMSESRLLSLSDKETYFTKKDYKPEHFTSFRKAVYDKTEGIAEDIKQGADQDLLFKLEEVAPIFVLDKITYKYRWYSHGISHDYTEESLYWNLVVRHRTCIRRGLDPKSYPIKDFISFWRGKYEEGRASVKSSRAFRLGYALLKPISWLWKK